ncbi:hypothetical protein OQA88_11807 [Cercophora sp. LCS_1]
MSRLIGTPAANASMFTPTRPRSGESSTEKAFENGLAGVGYGTDGEKKIQKVTGKALKALVPVVGGVMTPVRAYQNNPVSFWIDTLCVPLEQPYRNLAIARMKDTYARGRMTIVLDSELQTIEAKRCSDEEMMLHLGCDMLRFLCQDGPLQLPVWRDEVFQSSHAGYFLPRMDNFTHRMSEKFPQWMVKKGGSPYTPPNVPQNRIDDMVKAKKSFSVKKRVLEDAKKFFEVMRMAWMNLGPFSPPDLRVARMVRAW